MSSKSSPRLPSRTHKTTQDKRQRNWKYLSVIALSMLAVVVAISFVIRLGDSVAPGATQECGWDLTEPEGIQAHNIYVTQTAQWLGNRDPSSAEQPPPPDTPYWRGDCPADSEADLEPPIHEDDH